MQAAVRRRRLQAAARSFGGEGAFPNARRQGSAGFRRGKRNLVQASAGGEARGYLRRGRQLCRWNGAYHGGYWQPRGGRELRQYRGLRHRHEKRNGYRFTSGDSGGGVRQLSTEK